MSKYFLTALLFFYALAAGAQGVSYLTITDEAQYKTAADFTNTFEIHITAPGGGRGSKCQAVRIARDWFITAAHCISPACDNGCEVLTRLVVTPRYEMGAIIAHTPQKPRVFKNDKTLIAKAKSVYDMTLINVPAKTAQYIYRVPARSRQITEELFLKLIPDFNVYYKAVNGTRLPPILQLSGGYSAVIDKEASVVSIWDGERSVMQARRPLYYMPAQKYIFTENFGIKQGISGSGLMSNTGELLGIVSATATLEAQNDKTNKKTSARLVFIVPFDNYIVNFIRRTTGTGGGPEIKKAPRRVLKPIKPSQNFLPNALEKAISPN